MPINDSVPCRCMHIVIDLFLVNVTWSVTPHPLKGSRIAIPKRSAELSIGDPIEAVSGEQIADFCCN